MGSHAPYYSKKEGKVPLFMRRSIIYFVCQNILGRGKGTIEQKR
jgi:hypothetical protein